jgi:hypothetical protein
MTNHIFSLADLSGELAQQAILLATAIAQAGWLILWVRRCKSLWEPVSVGAAEARKQRI